MQLFSGSVIYQQKTRVANMPKLIVTLISTPMVHAAERSYTFFTTGVTRTTL